MIYIFFKLLYRTRNMSEEDNAKHDIIEAVFYDDEYGYGNKNKHIKIC